MYHEINMLSDLNHMLHSTVFQTFADTLNYFKETFLVQTETAYNATRDLWICSTFTSSHMDTQSKEEVANTEVKSNKMKYGTFLNPDYWNKVGVWNFSEC